MTEDMTTHAPFLVSEIHSVPQAVTVLGFGLVAADGEVSLEELSELVGALGRHYALDEVRVGDLLLFARYLYQQPDASGKAIRFLSSALDMAGKESLARFLGELAQSDGELREAEQAFARMVFRGL
jgi:uncharacterized tellurite resistance protein B-like protein